MPRQTEVNCPASVRSLQRADGGISSVAYYLSHAFSCTQFFSDPSHWDQAACSDSALPDFTLWGDKTFRSASAIAIPLKICARRFHELARPPTHLAGAWHLPCCRYPPYQRTALMRLMSSLLQRRSEGVSPKFHHIERIKCSCCSAAVENSLKLALQHEVAGEWQLHIVLFPRNRTILHGLWP